MQGSVFFPSESCVDELISMPSSALGGHVIVVRISIGYAQAAGQSSQFPVAKAVY